MVDRRFGRARRAWRTILYSAASLSALPLAAAAGGPASPGCNMTVGPGGKVTLTEDILNCPGVALNVVGPVILDGAAHRITCISSASGVGIDVMGKGAKISNLRVESCGVVLKLDEEGKHSVTSSYLATSGEDIVRITSNANKLTGNVIHSVLPSTEAGVRIDNSSVGNTISKNLFSGSSGGGIDVGVLIDGFANKITGNAFVNMFADAIAEDGSQGNKIQGNLIYNSLGDGIDLEGGGDSVSKNFVADGDGQGITTSAGLMDSKISGNVVMGTTAQSLYDPQSDCGSVTWSKNVFQSSNRSCIQ